MRPYRQKSIIDLELLFDHNRDDPWVCEHVGRELAMRKQTPRVKSLHGRVVQRIGIGFRIRDQPGNPISVPTKPGWWDRLLDALRRWFGANRQD
jgi:hypothetical protein